MLTQQGSEWQVILSDQFFNQIDVIQDFESLEVTLSTDQVSTLTLQLPVSYAGILTELGAMPTAANPCVEDPGLTVQLLRRVNWGAWYIESDMVFFVRIVADELTADKERFITIDADESKHLLHDRQIVTQPEDPAGNFEDVPADTIITTLFQTWYSTGAAATPPDPAYDWISSGLVSVVPAAGECDVHTNDFSQQSLYDAFTSISEFAKGKCQPIYCKFAPTITTTAIGERATLPLVFSVQKDNYGEDRTQGNTDGNTPVVLSPKRGSINSFRSVTDWTQKKSVQYVFGEEPIIGVEVNDDAVAANVWGWREGVTVDSAITDANAAQQAAVTELNRTGINNEQFDVELISNGESLFGQPQPFSASGHWWLGDKVTLDWCSADSCLDPSVSNISLAIRNTSVNIVIENCTESITAKFELADCKTCEPTP